MTNKQIEIERKFVVRNLKSENFPEPLVKKNIISNYLYVSDTLETRIIHVSELGNDEYYLTSKKKTDDFLLRIEYDLKISEDHHKALLECSLGRIVKTRHLYPNNIEVDFFRGLPFELIILEREFDSIEGASAPVSSFMPAYISSYIEVTDCPELSNSHIAIRGISYKYKY